ncbi:hypothetical protein [Microbacterium sp. Root322]|nr:hypothetical protein [Microbacterium sp. Root322]
MHLGRLLRHRHPRTDRVRGIRAARHLDTTTTIAAIEEFLRP